MSLQKLILNEIKKIKESIKDWKTVLIQYKSRIEKKRSWKDKQKFHKEIEETLAKMQENEKVVEKKGEIEVENVNINEEEKKEEEESLNDDEDDYNSVDDDQFVANDDNDDDRDSNSSGIISDTEITQVIENLKKDEIKPAKRPLKRKNEDNDVESKKIIIEKKKEFFNPNFKTNYKPKQNPNSKVMVIKQIALDELSSGGEDEIQIVKTREENKGDDRNQAKQTASDPFFLPSNGVIQTVDTSNARVDNSIRDKYDDFDDDGRSKRFKNSRYLDSTFTNLSSSRDYNNRSSYYPSQNRNENTYNNRYDNKQGTRDNNSRSSSGYAVDRTKTNGFNYNERYQEKAKPVEDDSNLHPSWKAKREQEEKLKLLKFQGTKVTFDD